MLKHGNSVQGSTAEMSYTQEASAKHRITEFRHRVRKNFIPSYLKMEKLELSAEKKPNQTLPLKSHIEILSVFKSGLLEASTIDFSLMKRPV